MLPLSNVELLLFFNIKKFSVFPLKFYLRAPFRTSPSFARLFHFLDITELTEKFGNVRKK